MRLIGYLEMRAHGAVVEGGGFQEQERQVREWAARGEHEVVRLVCERRSTNGPSRTLADAIRAVEAGEADAIIVASRGNVGPAAPTVQVFVADTSEARRPRPPLTRPRKRRAPQAVPSVLGMLVAAGLAFATQGEAGATQPAPKPAPTLRGECVTDVHVDAAREFDMRIVPCHGSHQAQILTTHQDATFCRFVEGTFGRFQGKRVCLVPSIATQAR